MQGFTWYEFWTRILPEWLAGIGTVGAVVVALWLAQRDSSIRLRLRVGVRMLITSGEQEPGPDYLMFDVVNVGRRPATVINLGWEYGWPWSKTRAMQRQDPRVGPGLVGKLPVTLADGQSESYFMLLDQWLAANRKDMFRPGPRWPWLACRLMRGTVYTSTGGTYRCRIESGLVDAMLQRGHYRQTGATPKE